MKNREQNLDTSGNTMKAVYSEFFMTFLLTLFVGSGLCLNGITGGNVGSVEIASMAGLSVFLGVWLTGRISGAHLNPAVSLALWIQEELGLEELIAYWVSQFAGGLAAALLLRLFFPMESEASVLLPASGMGYLPAFVAETLFTFLFVLVILLHPPAVDTTSWFALSVSTGMTYGIGVLITLHISGGSLNPARSLGPALAHLDFESLWIYLTAPFLGALLASFVRKSAFRGEI